MAAVSVAVRIGSMMKSRLLTVTALAVLATALGGCARNSFVISTLKSCDGFSAVTFLADPGNQKGLASCCIKCLMKQQQQQRQPCVNNGSNCGCSAVQFNPSATTKQHCMLLSGTPQNDSCGVIAVTSDDTSSTLTPTTAAAVTSTTIAVLTAAQYGGRASPADINLLQTIELTQGSALTDGHTTATAQQYATDTGVTFVEQHATSSTSRWSSAGGDMSSSLSSELLSESYLDTKLSHTPIVQALTEDSQTQGCEAHSTEPSVAGDSVWPSSWPATKLTKGLNVPKTAEVATSPTVSVTSNGSSSSGNISNSSSGNSNSCCSNISNNSNITDSNISNSNISNISNIGDSSNSSSINSSSSGISGSTSGHPSPHLNFSSVWTYSAWQATSEEPISGKSSLPPTAVGATGTAIDLPYTSQTSVTLSQPLPPPDVTLEPAAVASSSASMPTSGVGAAFVTYDNFTTIARTHSATVGAAAANQMETSLPPPPPPAMHAELSPPPPCTSPPNGDVSDCASAAAIAVSAASTQTGSPPQKSGTAGQPLNSTQSVPPPPPSLPPSVS